MSQCQIYAYASAEDIADIVGKARLFALGDIEADGSADALR